MFSTPHQIASQLLGINVAPTLPPHRPFLHGLGALGSTTTLIPGFEFEDGDSEAQFVGGFPHAGPGNSGEGWPGVSVIIISEFSKNMASSNPAAQQFLAAESDEIRRLMKNVDTYIKWDQGIFGRSATQANQYINALKELKTEILKVNDYMAHLPTSTLPSSISPSTAPIPIVANNPGQSTYATMPAPADTGTSVTTYALYGVGGLLLLALGYVALRR